MTRQIPHNSEAEQAIMGCLIYDGARTIEYMTEHGFSIDMLFFPLHRACLEVCIEMYKAGKQLDILTIRHEMNARDLLEKVGQEWCEQMADLAMLPNLGEYINLVRDLHLRREALRRCEEITERLYDNTQPAMEVVRSSDFYDLTVTGGVRQTNEQILSSHLERYVELSKTEGKINGIRTGLKLLDKIICGWQPGLNIVAGRPSAGKSSFEGLTAEAAVSHGVPVARLTIDMDHRRVLARDLARRGQVSLAKANFGYAGKCKKDMDRMTAAAADLGKMPMYIYDAESLGNDIDAVVPWIRMMKSKYGVGLVTIDYIQQLTAPNRFKDSGSPQELAYISQQLKFIGNQLHLPIVALAQFNREAEKMKRAPRMSDLGGSGALERDARDAIFLYSNDEFDYANAGIDPESARAVICEVAKQQDGRKGSLCLWLYGPYFRFVEAGKEWGNTRVIQNMISEAASRDESTALPIIDDDDDDFE